MRGVRDSDSFDDSSSSSDNGGYSGSYSSDSGGSDYSDSDSPSGSSDSMMGRVMLWVMLIGLAIGLIIEERNRADDEVRHLYSSAYTRDYYRGMPEANTRDRRVSREKRKLQDVRRAREVAVAAHVDSATVVTGESDSLSARSLELDSLVLVNSVSDFASTYETVQISGNGSAATAKIKPRVRDNGEIQDAVMRYWCQLVHQYGIELLYLPDWVLMSGLEIFLEYDAGRGSTGRSGYNIYLSLTADRVDARINGRVFVQDSMYSNSGITVESPHDTPLAFGSLDSVDISQPLVLRIVKDNRGRLSLCLNDRQVVATDDNRFPTMDCVEFTFTPGTAAAGQSADILLKGVRLWTIEKFPFTGQPSGLVVG
ncbi:MAG: hypothetical protein V1846_03755 [Candidatus Komeilibacteria bacterium]